MKQFKISERKNTLNAKYLIFIVCFFLYTTQTFAQNPPPRPSITSVSPDPSNQFCPIPFTFNEIDFEVKDISSTEVEFYDFVNLTIQNVTHITGNKIQGQFRFNDQWTQIASVKIKVKDNSTNYYHGQKIAEYVFPKVQSVFQRNIFRIAPNNKIISVPICQSTTNISFTKIQYVRLNGNEAVYNDLFGDIDSYQYQLPSGVTPVSGLTPVVGLPNTYSGNNNVSVSLSNAFINYTIKVRPTNTNCLQSSAGNYNDIILERPQLSVSGISSIRCGETDTKTFTVQNIPASPNCISNYTWQIANKGWKYNGSIPTTNVITTTPSIQLQSADNNSTPPQSFSVVVTSGSNSITLNKSINYLTPAISLPTYSAEVGINCEEAAVTAILANSPLTSYNLLWSTTNGFEINGNTSPQSSGANPTATVSKAGSVGYDNLKVSLQASCGTIESNSWSFEGCLPWSNLTVISSNYPMHPEPLIVNCTTEDNLAWLVDYEWYWLTGSGYTLIENTNAGLSLWTMEWPCEDRSLYVRARGFNGSSALKYVGEFSGFCSGYRLINQSVFNVYPNPTSNYVLVNYSSNSSSYDIKVADWQGNLKVQLKIKNNPKLDKGLTKIDISKLPKGKYIVAIQDGKKIQTKIIEKL